VKPINLAGFTDAVSVDGRIHPFRVVDVSDAELTQPHRQAGSLRAGALTIPTVINRLMGFVDSRENFHQHRKTLLENLAGAVTANIDASDEVFAAAASLSMVSRFMTSSLLSQFEKRCRRLV
jgi:hypothetical protein